MTNNDLVTNLIELRKRLIYIIIGILIVFLVLFRYGNDIYLYLAYPFLHATYLPKVLPPLTSNISPTIIKLISTDVGSSFFIPMKLTLLCAIFISLPNTIYQIWLFLAPAMYKHERLLLFGVIISSVILFTIGALFCYFCVLPIFFKFLISFKSPSIDLMIDITKYYDFILNMFMIFGITFLTPIFVTLLIYFNIISYSKFKKIRPYVFVGCFIVSAIITPPDVLSQIILAGALYVLYECGLLIGYFIRKKL